MGRQPTNRYENPAVGQALGLRRPLRPPGRAFNNLRWVFDRARVRQDPLFGERSSPETKPRPRPLTPAHKARKATHHPPPPANPTTWALIVRRHNPCPQPLAPARNARPATLAACPHRPKELCAPKSSPKSTAPATPTWSSSTPSTSKSTAAKCWPWSASPVPASQHYYICWAVWTGRRVVRYTTDR